MNFMIKGNRLKIFHNRNPNRVWMRVHEDRPSGKVWFDWGEVTVYKVVGVLWYWYYEGKGRRCVEVGLPLLNCVRVFLPQRSRQ